VSRSRRLIPAAVALVLALGGSAAAGELDRVAAAVDGAESSHGADPRMWRADPAGPQGPMQVTAAAATDVGGGDRFDLTGNLALGRAYLARMHRRFGSWADAVVAYNWGPGRVDAWIADGRSPERLPFLVSWYRYRVLSAAGLPYPARDAALFELHGTRRGLGIVHAQPRSGHRPGRGGAVVERLYAQVIRASLDDKR
jgi:Transglycosylase SLT domain